MSRQWLPAKPTRVVDRHRTGNKFLLGVRGYAVLHHLAESDSGIERFFAFLCCSFPGYIPSHPDDTTAAQEVFTLRSNPPCKKA